MSEQGGDREPILRVTGVECSYGSTRVLFGATLAVPSGAVLGLIGPNGAGKTTLLRAIAGLQPIEGGSIVLDGTDITQLSPQERASKGLLTVLAGRDALFASLSVDDNLSAGGELLAERATDLKDRIREMYQLFPELEARRGTLAVQLSGGEQQMLALAKGLMLHPHVMCVDEMSLGLAPSVTRRLLPPIEAVATSGGAVLLVEESMDTATSIATSIVRLERGVVRSAPSPLPVRPNSHRSPGDHRPTSPSKGRDR